MNKRAELDTKNPPGQVTYPPKGRYLRDIINRIQREEIVVDEPYSRLKQVDAPTVSTDAEKRLEGLKTALLRLLGEMQTSDTVSYHDLHRIIKENS